eukprot:TRINITY_DN11713_c0_g1_i1.p1 TRINITY_DN11713_c0_g1~~TRINITY_DN11713_c0_g1_i1.p1  ORF type:complete len:291 (+),score=36.52 TRINITY_DN11713_c0_g1_i1:93-965(+)
MNSDVEGSSPKAFYGVMHKRRIPVPVGGYQTVKDLLTQTDGVSQMEKPVVPLGKKPIGPGKNSTSSDWIKLDEQPSGPPEKTHLRIDESKLKTTDIFNLSLDHRPGRKIIDAPKPPEDKPIGIRQFASTPSYDPFQPPTEKLPSPPPAKRMVQLDHSNKGQNSFVPIERQLGQRKRVEYIPGEATKDPVYISHMPVSSLRSTQLDGFLVRAAQREAREDFRQTQERQERGSEAQLEKGDVRNLDAWDKAHKRPKEPEVKPLPSPVKPAPGKLGKPGAAKQASSVAAVQKK